MESNEVSPRQVFAEVAAAVPPDVHPNIIIIGSLAAAFRLIQGDDTFGVRTKDIDCVLSPHVSAVEKGRIVAERLIAAHWQPRSEGEFGRPGTKSTPADKLPAVRLYPPTAINGLSNCLPNRRARSRPIKYGRPYHWHPAITMAYPVLNSLESRLSMRRGLHLGSGALDLK